MQAVLRQPVEERDTAALVGLYEAMLGAADADDGSRLVELDMRFHREIVWLSGNQALPDVIGPLLSQTAAFISITNLVYFESLREVAETHLSLIDLVQNGTDVTKGRIGVHQHLTRIWERVESGDPSDNPADAQE